MLIRGAAGGVGSAALQLANTRGAHVTAVVRGAHLDRVREIGEFDVIIDTVGKGVRPFRNRLKRSGRYLSIAVGGPGDIVYMLTSRILGSRRIRFVNAPPTGTVLAPLAAEVDAGDLKPVIENVYWLAEIVTAHRAAQAGGVFGKQVIRYD